MEAYRLATHFWEKHGFEVIAGDPHRVVDEFTPPFHLAEARNWVVERAQGIYDVVVVADADTIPGDIEQIWDAIILAQIKPARVVYPFTEYCYVSSTYVETFSPEEVLEALCTFMPRWVKKNSVGGILVCTPETYFDFGGMDERFERRWGFEDNAFEAVAETLGQVDRVVGKVYSFSHDDDTNLRDWSKKNPNYWRNELYQAANGCAPMMRELLKR